jgi:integrase/recombinase XerD
MRMEHAVADYLEVLRDRGVSAHTVRAYRADLHDLARVVTDIGTARDDVALAQYAASLGGLSAAASRRRLSAVTGFVSWATSRGLTSAELRPVLAASRPAASSRADQLRPAAAPRAADVEAALRQIPRQADRDQLLFGLMARLGLRPGEAIGLRIEDVDVRREVLTVAGWGGRSRRVVIDDNEVLQRLRNWLRPESASQGPLFPSPSGRGPLRYQSIAERWAVYADEAGVAVTPGDLRRAHSAELLAAGVPEWVVRDRLGQSTGPLPGAGGTAAAAEAVIRGWQHHQTRPEASPADPSGERQPADTGKPETAGRARHRAS